MISHTLEDTMNEHQQDYRFETDGPVRLHVEIGAGSVTATATETTESGVTVTGKHADEVRVSHDGDQISVVAPKDMGGWLGRDRQVDVTVTVPTGSTATVRTGSADITLDGTFDAVSAKSGSGDVEIDRLLGSGQVETGSGDVHVVASRAIKIKSGSGDVVVETAEGAVLVSTGSGDVRLGTTSAGAVVKTGSGDLRVEESHDDVSLSTGSGNLTVARATRGRVTLKGASGDAEIGIPTGTPVWTDINTLSGSIRSSLTPTGAPREGADHVEVRAKTVSGDIHLSEV